jgi:hypothetical protein
MNRFRQSKRRHLSYSVSAGSHIRAVTLTLSESMSRLGKKDRKLRHGGAASEPIGRAMVPVTRGSRSCPIQLCGVLPWHLRKKFQGYLIFWLVQSRCGLAEGAMYKSDGICRPDGLSGILTSDWPPGRFVGRVNISTQLPEFHIRSHRAGFNLNKYHPASTFLHAPGGRYARPTRVRQPVLQAGGGCKCVKL